jgi:hypothetical protein
MSWLTFPLLPQRSLQHNTDILVMVWPVYSTCYCVFIYLYSPMLMKAMESDGPIDVAVEGPWKCIWFSLLFKQLLNSVVWSCFLFSLGWWGFHLFHAGWWVAIMLSNLNYLYNLVIGSSPSSFQVELLVFKYQQFSLLMKIYNAMLCHFISVYMHFP